MAKKVTLIDIANETGLSISTVHRALQRSPTVNKETGEKVIQIAQAMGYWSGRMGVAPNPAKFAVLCPDNEFFAEALRGIEYAKRRYRYAGCQVELILSEHYRVGEQSDQLRELLNRADFDFDGIAIAPANALLLNALLQRAHDLGAHVVTFNNDAPESCRECFVGENPVLAGETAALLYNRVLQPGQQIAVMTSHLLATGLRSRTEAFIAKIRELNKVEVLGVFEYMDEPEAAEEVAVQILKNLSPNAIFTNSMWGSVGAASALEQMQTDNGEKVLLVGFDVCERVCAYLENDTMFATLSQEPFTQGYQAIKLLMKLCTGQTDGLRDIYHTYTEVLLKTNLRGIRPEMVRGEMSFT
ncbi:MAG: substrate-binding domain-containing protein [Clostridia bacterium]|nr:substrate-binding domain-containing protein [Clostridia bacterium]